MKSVPIVVWNWALRESQIAQGIAAEAGHGGSAQQPEQRAPPREQGEVDDQETEKQGEHEDRFNDGHDVRRQGSTQEREEPQGQKDEKEEPACGQQ